MAQVWNQIFIPSLSKSLIHSLNKKKRNLRKKLTQFFFFFFCLLTTTRWRHVTLLTLPPQFTINTMKIAFIFTSNFSAFYVENSTFQDWTELSFLGNVNCVSLLHELLNKSWTFQETKNLFRKFELSRNRVLTVLMAYKYEGKVIITNGGRLKTQTNSMSNTLWVANMRTSADVVHSSSLFDSHTHTQSCCHSSDLLSPSFCSLFSALLIWFCPLSLLSYLRLSLFPLVSFSLAVQMANELSTTNDGNA